MKSILKFALFFMLTSIIFSQTKKNTCNTCKPEVTNTIKVTYEHLVGKYNFPKVFSYKIDTYLYINDTVAQYVYDRKTKVVRDGKYQTQIGFLKYVNNYYFKTNLMEEQRDLQDIKIKTKWKPDYKWEITNETKTIMGYTVRKAIANSIEIPKDRESYYGKVIAWFTEEIPIPVGPDRYVGLPGLILEVEYENTNMKTMVKKIEFNPNTELKDISEGIMVEDKDDVIFYWHKNKKFIKQLKSKNKKSFLGIF